jgi:hypothetical protein
MGINKIYAGLKNKTKQWLTELDPGLVWHFIRATLASPKLRAGPTVSGSPLVTLPDAISGLENQHDWPGRTAKIWV